MRNMLCHFRVVRRPAGVSSCYTLLVVDGAGLPHQPLTVFHHKLSQMLSDGAARTYLNSILAFFSYLATDEWRLRRGDRWDSPPADVQEAIRDYLVYRLGCKVQPRDTYAVVSLTAQSPSTIRVFLAAIKQFYQITIWQKMYKYDSPLIDASSRILREIEREEGMSRHQMPQVSGVENPITVYQSESFFRLAKDHWEVSPVEDPDLATNLIKAFKPAKLSLRDQIIVRMALESGARIREILQLTVGDWRKLGGKQEARACSKGSRGRRVKRIRFSDTTAKMLRQYLNTDRAALDLELRRLEQLADQDSLFLSQRHKPFDYEAFKPHWKKLCCTTKVQLRIHDLRHWYVSMSMRIIAESAKTSAEIVLRKEELVRYMAWRSSDTIATYEKYFKGIQHYPIQDQVHQQLNEEVSRYLRQKTKKSSKQQERSQKRQGDIPQQITSNGVEAPINPNNGWERLLALGGMQ